MGALRPEKVVQAMFAMVGEGSAVLPVQQLRVVPAVARAGTVDSGRKWLGNRDVDDRVDICPEVVGTAVDEDIGRRQEIDDYTGWLVSRSSVAEEEGVGIAAAECGIARSERGPRVNRPAID